MTQPPTHGTRITGWLVLIGVAVLCWLCGFASAALTLLGI